MSLYHCQKQLGQNTVLQSKIDAKYPSKGLLCFNLWQYACLFFCEIRVI